MLEIAWTMMATTCLTLGAVHLFAWQFNRTQYASLLFFVMAASVAVCGVFELRMMNAQAPEAYAEALRWAHIPISATVLSMVAFLRLYLKSGSTPLAYTVCAGRLLALVLNFTTGVNLNFETITAIDHVASGGVTIALPIGTLNPWWMVAQIDNVLLVAFVTTASLELWRRGDKAMQRRALLVGGSILLCALIVISSSVFIFRGHLRSPTLLTPAFSVVVLAMAYELAQDLVRAAQMSAALQRSERDTRLAAYAAKLTYWSWNNNSQEFWISPFGREILGIAPHESLTLQAFLGHVHPEDRATLGHAIEAATATGGTLDQEFRIVLPGLAHRWMSAHGRAALDSTDESALLYGVAYDITGRVLMERAVEQHRSELAHITRVTSMGALASSLAHEINQPLMSILANAEAAMSLIECGEQDSPELREMMADILESDRRAGEIIARMRELMRRGQPQTRRFEMNTLIEDVLRLIRSELIHRGVSVETELDPALPELLGDYVQLQQVLVNLVLNACDAMDGQDMRRLRIATRKLDAGPVQISVADSGTGITAATPETIFEPFFTTKSRGMGQGLSVCRTIVDAHGGRLEARNNDDGRGATFSLELQVPQQDTVL